MTGTSLTGLAASVTFDENTVNATPQLLAAAVAFTSEVSLSGGRLVVSGLLTEDRLSVLTQGDGAGQIGVSGSTISYGGIAFGTASGGSGADFTVSFNANVTTAAVDALIQRLAYADTSDTPTATRDLTINVFDGAGVGLGQGGGGIGLLTALTGSDNPFNGINVGYNSKPSFVDLDGDGRLDLVSGENSGTFLAWHNTGSGYTALTGSDNPFNGINVGKRSTPAFVDLDGDGRLDLVSGQFYGTLLTWRNDAPLPTITVTVTAQNDAPSVTSAATASFAENGTGTAYQAAGTDPEGTALSYTLGGTDAALFDISSAGAVTFKVAPNFEAPADSGADNVYDITVTASDGSLSSAARAVAITVTNVVEATALTGLAASVTFDENTVNATPQLLDAAVTFISETSLSGGRLVVSGMLAEDRLSVLTQGSSAGQIGVSGSTISYGGIAFGTASGGSGADFTVSFNANVTAAAVDALIQRLAFADTSNTPTATRDLTINVVDGAGVGLGGGIGPLTALTGSDNPFGGINVGSTSTPAFVDLDADGRLDLVSGAFGGTFLAWHNTGSGYTALTGSDNPFNGIDVGGYNSAPSFVALDADGRLDLVSGEMYGKFLAWHNTGNSYTVLTGSAKPFNGFDVGNNSTPAFVDLDGDGRLDLVSGEYDGTLKAWHNTGSGYTALTGSANPFNGFDVGNTSTPAFVDLDGDGRLDLVSGEYYGTLLAWHNTGSGYTALTGSANPFNGFDVGFRSTPAFVDLDGDGRLDLVSGETFGTLKLWHNDATLLPKITVTVTVQNDAPSVTSAATASFAENGTGTAYQATGTDPEGTALSYSLGGTDATLFDISSAGAVTFAVTPNFEAPADDGTDNVYNITVTASDGTLSSAAQAVAITVTNVNDAPSITSAATASFAENATGTAYQATGTDPEGTALSYTLGGADAALFDVSSSGAVTFKAAPNFEAPADDGTDNVYNITVTASDGTLSSAAQDVAITVTNVNEVPTETIAELAFSADTGTAGDFITNTAAQTITGTVSSALLIGETVQVSLDGGTTWHAASTQPTAGGTSFADAVTLSGAGTLQVKVANVSYAGASASQPYVLDTAAPAAPTALANAAISNTYVNAAQDIQGQAVTGTAEADAVVTVFDGNTQLGTTTADGSGAWSYPLDHLPDGLYSLTATATDAAGNISVASNSLVFEVDTAAPAAPTALANAAISNTYVNAAQDIQGQALTGTAEADAVVTVFDGNTQLGTTTADGSGAWSYPLDHLPDGLYSLTATATDAAGNISVASTALAFTVDTAAPTVSSIATSGTGITAGAGDLNTGHSVTFTMTASEAVNAIGSSLALSDGGTAGYVSGTGTSTVTYSYTVGTGENSADLTVTGESGVTDLAGNALTSSAVNPAGTLQIDTIAPTVAITSGGGDVTKVAQTISGTGEAGTSVQLFDGATALGAPVIVVNGGTWTAAVTLIGNGAHSITAEATDLAGNVGTSTALSYNYIPGIVIAPTANGVAATGGAGDDTMAASGFVDSLYGGSGDDSITASGAGNLLSGGDGDDSLTASGWNSTVNGGVGDDHITATAASAVIDGGSGDNTIQASGWGDRISAADGQNSVTSTTGGAVITLGNGGNQVTAGGYGNSITTGSGNDTISLGVGGGTTVDAGGGDDTVIYSGPSAQYHVQDNHDGTLTVAGQNGNDTLRHVEHVLFSDTAPQPPAPTTAHDTLHVAQDAASNLGNVLTNDLPATGGATLYVTGFNIEGHDYAVGARATLAGGAVFSIAADGSVTLTQNNAYDSLAAGANRELVFTYTVNEHADGSGPSAIGDASIELTGLNDAPTTTADNRTIAAASSTSLGNVLGNDHDVDSGDILHVTSFNIEGQTYLAGQTATLGSGATFSVAADGSQTLTQNHAYDSITTATSITFTYTVNDRADGSGLSANGTASVTLTPQPPSAPISQYADASGQVLTGGAGNDNLSASGYNEVINAGAGDDSIDGGVGNASIDAGAGNNSIAVRGYNNSITAADGDNVLTGGAGNATVRLGNGTETITLGGYGNVITIGETTAGHVSTISAGTGTARVTTAESAAGGDVHIILSGNQNTVTIGDGNDTIEGSQGSTTIHLGNGDNSVTALGYGNLITAGTGSNSIHAGAGQDTVVSGGGDDEIWLTGWSNTVDGHLGGDVTIHGGQGNSLYIAPPGGTGVAHILNFNLNGGDHIRFNGLSAADLSFQVSGNDLHVLALGTEVVDLVGLGSLSTSSFASHGAFLFA